MPRQKLDRPSRLYSGTILFRQNTYSAKTDSNGSFVISFIPPGVWNLNFEPNGKLILSVTGITVEKGTSADLGLIDGCVDVDGDGDGERIRKIATI